MGFFYKNSFDIDLYDEEDLELCEAYAIDITAGEILTEFSTVCRNAQFGMCIAVNPDQKRNLKGMEYFKVYKHIDPLRATKIARIKFRESDYVIHHRNGGKKNWVLNTKERTNLIKILNSPSIEGHGKYVWNEMIYYFNKESGKLLLPEDLPIPNYHYLIDIK